MVELDNLAELVCQNPKIVVGTDEVPDWQVMMDGLSVEIEDEKMDDLGDVFDRVGLDLGLDEDEL